MRPFVEKWVKAKQFRNEAAALSRDAHADIDQIETEVGRMLGPDFAKDRGCTFLHEQKKEIDREELQADIPAQTSSALRDTDYR